MPKYCTNCGAKLIGKYCSECGTRAITEAEEEKRKLRAAKKEFTHRRFEKTHRIIDLHTDLAAWEFAERVVDYSIGCSDLYFPGKTKLVQEIFGWSQSALNAVTEVMPEKIRKVYKEGKEGNNGAGVFDR